MKADQQHDDATGGCFITNPSKAPLKLTGVAPAVCDAEAGQQYSSRSELTQERDVVKNAPLQAFSTGSYPKG